MWHLLTDLWVSLRALEIFSQTFLSFIEGYISFVKLIYFYRNSQVTKILFVCNYSGIKNVMLQLFTCEKFHLFLLIKYLSCSHSSLCQSLLLLLVIIWQSGYFPTWSTSSEALIKTRNYRIVSDVNTGFHTFQQSSLAQTINKWIVKK